jgi:hypothetical protein
MSQTQLKSMTSSKSHMVADWGNDAGCGWAFCARGVLRLYGHEALQYHQIISNFASTIMQEMSAFAN